MAGEWMTTAEVADMFGVSTKTVDDWCYRRRLRFYKPGRDRRFRRSDCNAFMEATAVEADQP